MQTITTFIAIDITEAAMMTDCVVSTLTAVTLQPMAHTNWQYCNSIARHVTIPKADHGRLLNPRPPGPSKTINTSP
jgi:hypothetical protein